MEMDSPGRVFVLNRRQWQPANMGLGRGAKRVEDIGFFLKSQAQGARRVELYLKRLSDIYAQI